MAVSAVKKEAVKAAPEAAIPAPPPKKGTRKWKLPLIALFVAGAAGGGAYWYSIQNQGDAAGNVKVVSAKPPQFLPLEQFTVNLLIEDNPQFLQVGLTLKVADNAAVDALKLHMPEVRDSILRLLSSQKASNLLTLDGKRKLAAEIVAAINTIVAPGAAAPSPVQTTAAAAKTEPAAAGDAPAAEATAATAEAGDTPAAAAEAPPPVLSVLFTSFIIQ